MYRKVSRKGAKKKPKAQSFSWRAWRPSLRLCVRLIAVFVAIVPLGVSAQNGAIDWPRYQDMAVDLMQQYLRINTSNPPGNELEAAKRSEEHTSELQSRLHIVC